MSGVGEVRDLRVPPIAPGMTLRRRMIATATYDVAAGGSSIVGRGSSSVPERQADQALTDAARFNAVGSRLGCGRVAGVDGTSN